MKHHPWSFGAAAILALVVFGCATGGGGGGGGGGQDSTPDSIGGQDATGNDDDAASSGGTGLPVIDCSGQPARTTGVNRTPFYDEFPAVGLPGGLLGADRPASVDLSAKLPTPCHQGQLRSCVAWATAYGMLTFYAADTVEGWGTPDRSDRQFSPPFLFNQANAFEKGRSRATDCTRAGSFVSDVLAFVQDTGCALMSDVPYINDGDCNTKPNPDIIRRAANYRIGYYAKVEDDVDTMKVYLLERTPVLVVASVGDDFLELGDSVYSHHDPEGGSAHCTLLVGYDDARQAMKLFNSWGTNWGDGGFGWVAYDIWADFVEEAWIAVPAFAGTAGELSAGAAGANPYVDSDGDGIADNLERFLADHQYDYDADTPQADGPLNVDARPDADLDGWADETEQLFGTDPNSFDEYPFMPGYEYPEGFFDQFDGSEGVLETAEDLGDLDTDGTDASGTDDGSGTDADNGDAGADLDNDGVPDAQDLCPGTLPGFIVDDNGCHLEL